MIVELLLRDLHRVSEILQQLVMFVLLCPVSRVEPVLVSNRRFHTRIDKDFDNLCMAVSCGYMKCREPRLVFDCGISSITEEQVYRINQVFLNGLMKRCVLTDFKVFLLVWICTVLQKQFN